VIENKHSTTCFIYDDGPCDCGLDEYVTDEQIDMELLEKEEAKD
jgi:hypothetical protein